MRSLKPAELGNFNSARRRELSDWIIPDCSHLGGTQNRMARTLSWVEYHDRRKTIGQAQSDN
jgi:hypothetical protein